MFRTRVWNYKLDKFLIYVYLKNANLALLIEIFISLLLSAIDFPTVEWWGRLKSGPGSKLNTPSPENMCNAIGEASSLRIPKELFSLEAEAVYWRSTRSGRFFSI